MDPRVRLTAAYLLEHLDQQIELQDLSRHVNLSCSYLTHLFQHETGMSPRSFLKKARLERARDLLETTFLSVKEVMARSGYNDPSHFVRDFETMFGESPRKYRKHNFRSNAISHTSANEQQKAPTMPDCLPGKRTA